jgi:hypothetical protein
VSWGRDKIKPEPTFFQQDRDRVIAINATLNNISVISLHSVLLVEETGVPGENQLNKTEMNACEHKFIPKIVL